MTDAYSQPIYRVMPRLLAFYDTDSSSDTYGVGDRFYWGWKLIDFANGTFQGAAAGLAGLLSSDALPAEFDEERILERIDAMALATRRVMAANGSLAEALPNEGSFCVTGLVAGDLLLAIERLGSRLPAAKRDQWLAVIQPLIQFLKVQDEYHGLISNHLATDALALVRWSDVSGEQVDQRARLWVDRILKHQSGEGWYKEYEGADAGYQTWCSSSLAAIHRLRPSWGLAGSLSQSLDFIAHAAHPDGSFGGLYGSRMTRFIFPAGFEMLSEEFPIASALAAFARKSIAAQTCVTMDSIDASNLVPFFNDYVTAQLEAKPLAEQEALLPFEQGQYRKVFAQSGWLVDAAEQHYTVLNLRKGGAGVHCVKGEPAKEVSALVVRNAANKLFTTQLHNDRAAWEMNGSLCNLQSVLRPVSRPRPDPLRFIILRMLSLTVLRSVFLGNWIKRMLAYLMISGQGKAVARVERVITLGKELSFEDKAVPERFSVVEAKGFKPIHMASMGYWQKND